MRHGAAAVCLNKQNQLLMLLQAPPHEPSHWALPYGNRDVHESYEDCCVRMVRESIGYEISIVEHLKTKIVRGEDVTTHIEYYRTELVGGEALIQNPSGTIYDVAWVSHEELQHLDLTHPDDRDFLLQLLDERKDT